MPYERTREIEQRFQKTLDLLKRKQLNAGQMALELGISRPTAQRIITELRNRGYKIRSVRDESGWRYELIGSPKG
jgi:biotin operon repressor